MQTLFMHIQKARNYYSHCNKSVTNTVCVCVCVHVYVCVCVCVFVCV